MAKDKHHEPQALTNVAVIRGRVLRMMARDLASLRSFISTIPGNEHVVEMLRGKPGEEILLRVADYVMQELGDNSSARGKANRSGVSRYLASKVKGAMGNDEEQEQAPAEVVA